MHRFWVWRLLSAVATCVALFVPARAQQIEKRLSIAADGKIDIVNHYGRVRVEAEWPASENTDQPESPSERSVAISANSVFPLTADELGIESSSSSVQIHVNPKNSKGRVDVSLRVPHGLRVKVETSSGEVLLAGHFRSASARTDTGTIAVDVPTDDLRYSLLWTASRPRFLSDFDLEKVKEKAGGKFTISGKFKEDRAGSNNKSRPDGKNADSESSPNRSIANGDGEQKKRAVKKPEDRIELDLETARGIILLNVPPNEVTADLRERPLTNAAKAIIRSGDSLLMEAIRRAAPKYYGDYTRTLPPLRMQPAFAERRPTDPVGSGVVKVASVRVSDNNNRAMADLSADDFEILENGEKRDIISVKRSAAPFNLVLLLDVSGSVDNYVDFIRKAARSFVNTIDSRDRLSIISFNDDVNVVSAFTTDKKVLSASLDTFDAGGGTAYYDALAYTLADTLRPLKGERTAIVALTDGDDNRSFLPFESMLSSIQESGALIYPLYVPSGLVASTASNQNAALDPLRSRYLQGELTSRAQEEGSRLASTSGGVFYPISQLSQIQTAYEDIVRQLRTAYEIEYRSQLGGVDAGVSPRLKIRSKRPNSYLQIRSVTSTTGR